MILNNSRLPIVIRGYLLRTSLHRAVLLVMALGATTLPPPCTYAQTAAVGATASMQDKTVFSRSLRFEGDVVEVLPSGQAIREIAVHRGKRFQWQRKVEDRAATPERNHGEPDTALDIDASTVEQLAEDLRGLMLFRGHEFIEAEAPLALAGRTKLYRDLERNGASRVDLQALLPASGPWQGSAEWMVRPEAAMPGNVGTELVHGVDDRIVMANTSYPYRAMIVFDNTSTGSGIDGSQGSGVLIGPSTAMSVAHVFWDETNDDWEATHRWAPGFDSADADSSPYGDWTGCYAVTIPAAYTTHESQNTYDYAVLDFDVGCNSFDDGVNSDEPGETVGWLGWYVASAGDIESSTGYVRGYPGVGTCGNPGQSCGVRVWGDFSTASENNKVDKEIRHYADTSDGNSGSGFYQYANPSCDGCGYGPYVVGMHRAGADSYNIARRLDSTVASFIEHHSSDY
jgi:V8-like Glu-specific endopeptidase